MTHFYIFRSHILVILVKFALIVFGDAFETLMKKTNKITHSKKYIIASLMQMGI